MKAHYALLGVCMMMAAEKDGFEVVGHIALGCGSISSMATTSHFSLNYVYAECSAAHTVTVIEVTDPSRPNVLSTGVVAGSVLTAAGDTALASSETSPSAAPAKTISIIDFSDKAHPKVTREFAGVTSMTRDERRGLVFLANAEGLWILHRHQALDPELEERYAHDVVYNH